MHFLYPLTGWSSRNERVTIFYKFDVDPIETMFHLAMHTLNVLPPHETYQRPSQVEPDGSYCHLGRREAWVPVSFCPHVRLRGSQSLTHLFAISWRNRLDPFSLPVVRDRAERLQEEKITCMPKQGVQQVSLRVHAEQP